MRLPETGGIGVVPETSLEHHRRSGWLRVSDALGGDERDQLRLADYAEAPDLDAPDASDEPAESALAEDIEEE